MKYILSVMIVFMSTGTFAQTDSLYLHNGKTMGVNIIRIADFTVVFKYAGEDAEQTVGKYAVNKILYGKSHREEIISEKIKIESEDVWEKVVFLVDKSETTGLTKVNEIKGKTALINARTPSGADSKATKDLKRKAAKEGCPFVLVMSDKDTHFIRRSSSSMSNSLKTGITYKY